MPSFRLDVDDAVVIVWKQEEGFWWYSFAWPDGSYDLGDRDWMPSEQRAKVEVLGIYKYHTGRILKKDTKRAKWIRGS